jgi:hypothetical protein
VTAACSGCELLALTWAELELEAGVVSVSKSLEQTKFGLRVKATKNESRLASVWMASPSIF